MPENRRLFRATVTLEAEFYFVSDDLGAERAACDYAEQDLENYSVMDADVSYWPVTPTELVDNSQLAYGDDDERSLRWWQDRAAEQAVEAEIDKRQMSLFDDV